MPSLSPIARVGDSISHGGQIISGDPIILTNLLATARLNDSVHCVIHGAQTINSASATVLAEGALGIARIGDSITCGATITSGSPNSFAGA